MFIELNNLIFGNEDFEKTRIEIRFLDAKKLALNLIIKNLEDFEIIQNCIYKIKELLRLKSSNLNKAIKDSSRNIKKRDVLELIEILEKVRTIYLENKNIEFSQGSNISITTQENKNNTQFKKEENKKDIDFIENEIIIILKSNYTIKLYNEKIPYILITFKSMCDYSVIKKISSIFFEVFMPHGTNIILEDKNTLIVPRFNEDNLILFPNPKINLEEVENKLVTKIKLEKKLKIKEKNDSNNENQVESSKDNYIENENLIQKKPSKKSLKQKEESLDKLLENLNSKNNNNNNNNNDSNNLKNENKNIDEFEKEKLIENEKIEIIQDEPITIEKKSKEEILKEEILTNRKDWESAKNKNKEKIEENELDLEDYVIYVDDKIKVYLESKSKWKAELVITTFNEDKIEKIDESTFSYMMIFSKIFSQILFGETNAEGTNLIIDYNKNKIKIIPRNKNDELDLNWELKNVSDDFLEQVKNKLFSVMSKEIGGQKDTEDKRIRGLGDRGNGEKEDKGNRGIGNRSVEKVSGEVIKQEPKKEKTLEDKAKYILESLRRIP